VDSTILNTITNAFIVTLDGAYAALQVYSLGLLAVFAVMHFYLTMSAAVMGQAPLSQGLATFVWTVLKIGVFYWLATSLYDLMRQVVDDGHKSYIIFPSNLAAMDAPMLRLIGPNGPELVNARQYGSAIIVDQLFTKAELRIGVGPQAETMTVTRQAPRTIDCPHDAECPIWPEEKRS